MLPVPLALAGDRQHEIIAFTAESSCFHRVSNDDKAEARRSFITTGHDCSGTTSQVTPQGRHR